MKLQNLKKFISNIFVLFALITTGSNALQLRDSGKAVQSANSNNNNAIDKKQKK